jgi:predicted enzyme related to lactoylglutathione lyase
VIQAVFAGLPVADFEAAIEFYERFFGRPADLVPKDGDSAWQLAEPGWVYVVCDADRSGRGLLTILVDDLDAHVAELAGRGIETDAIERIPGVLARTVVTDPAGNTIQLGQPLGG